MARKPRRKRKKINLGKTLGIVEKVGEGLAKFGGAIPMVGGMLQAAGNAMDMAAEAGQGVVKTVGDIQGAAGGGKGKRRGKGPLSRKRPAGALSRKRPEAAGDEGAAAALPAPDVPRSGPSPLMLGGLGALGLGLMLALKK